MMSFKKIILLKFIIACNLYAYTTTCYATQNYNLDELFPQKVKNRIAQQDINNLFFQHQLAKNSEENGYAKKAYMIGMNMLEKGKIDIGIKCLLYAESFYVPESLVAFYRISKNAPSFISIEMHTEIKKKFDEQFKSFEELHNSYKQIFTENVRILTSSSSSLLNYFTDNLKNISLVNQKKSSKIKLENISYKDQVYSDIELHPRNVISSIDEDLIKKNT